MSRWRSSMVLLGIAVIAMVIGFLRVLTEPTPQPPGSSYSAEPEGTLALFTWLQAVGATPQRLAQADQTSRAPLLFFVEPASQIDRATIDAAADQGETVVLAGGGIGWLTTARALGIEVEPVSFTATASSPNGLVVKSAGRFQLRADAPALPLLVRPDGAWAALRMPYRAGTLVFLASSEPLSNAGLSDANTARFVFRNFVQASEGASVVFVENQSPTGATSPGTNLNQLLFGTPPGWAIVYLALLTFAFLFLTGRRLGPALAAPAAEGGQRTMYEHVQMLANLYRRAGRLDAARTAFVRHYAHSPSVGAEALARIESAHTESDMIRAVNAIDDAR